MNNAIQIIKSYTDIKPKAALILGSGLGPFADTLDNALDLAVEVENLARVYCQVLQLGNPSVLDQDQMDAALAQFAGYRSS